MGSWGGTGPPCQPNGAGEFGERGGGLSGQRSGQRPPQGAARRDSGGPLGRTGGQRDSLVAVGRGARGPVVAMRRHQRRGATHAVVWHGARVTCGDRAQALQPAGGTRRWPDPPPPPKIPTLSRQFAPRPHPPPLERVCHGQRRQQVNGDSLEAQSIPRQQGGNRRAPRHHDNEGKPWFPVSPPEGGHGSTELNHREKRAWAPQRGHPLTHGRPKVRSSGRHPHGRGSRVGHAGRGPGWGLAARARGPGVMLAHPGRPVVHLHGRHSCGNKEARGVGVSLRNLHPQRPGTGSLSSS